MRSVANLRRIFAVLLSAITAVAATILTLGGDAAAAISAPFTAVFTSNANGAVIAIGNPLLTCADHLPNCTAAKNGAVYDNNYFNMTMLDVDTDAATFNSSSSDLSLPPGSQVLFARLYWGARLTAGDGGGTTTHASQTLANQIKFKVPGASEYENLTGTLLAVNTTSNNAYQSFVDVTQRVKAAGNGTYWSANVQAGTGADRYAGWALVIAYTAPGLPLRNLSVFQGFSGVNSTTPQSISVSGFKAPLAGTVDAQLSMVAYEGDLSQTGDYALLNKTQLANALSPGSNFFNSTNTLNGSATTNRTPNYPNMLGFDVKNLGVSGAIPNGATSTTFAFSSAGDAYFPGVLGLAINLYAPDFSSSSKSVTNTTSGAATAKPGDLLTYTLSYINTGQDPAVNLVSSDPLPPGVSYVPGSLILMNQLSSTSPAIQLSDASGDDRGEYLADTRTVRVRLGTDANATQGGRLNVGDAMYYQFQVSVDPSAGGTTQTNLAHLDYATGTTGVSAVYDTPPVSVPVASLADVSITKKMLPNPAIAGQAGTATLTVHNAGPNVASNVIVTDSTPNDYIVTGVNVSNGVSCPVPPVGKPISCAIGTLPVGGNVVITVSGRAAASSTATTLTNIATVATESFDPDMSNNIASVSTPMTTASDLSIEKTASPLSAPAGSTITYTLTATNNGPSDASNVVITDTVSNPKDLVIYEVATATAGLTCPSITAAGVQCIVPTLAAGEKARVNVKAYIVPSAAENTAIFNEATVSSPTTDPDPNNNENTEITVTAAQADLQVSKTASTSAYAGGSVSYTLNVTNLGPSDAKEVTLRDQLPSGFTPTSISYDRGSCNDPTLNSGQLVCTVANLPGPLGAGDITASLQVTLTGILAAETVPGNIPNQAIVSADTPDPVSANNTAQATTLITTLADLQVTKTANHSVIPDAGSGTTITYTITVSNAGPSTAHGVCLEDTLPSVLTLESVSPAASAGSCTGSGGTLWSLGNLTPGATSTVTVTMKAPTSYSTPPTSILQSAKVTSTDCLSLDTSCDPNPGNNTTTWTLTGTALPDLSITKTSQGDAPDGSLVAGGVVTYTLTVKNNDTAESATAPVQITDMLPSGLTFLANGVSIPGGGTSTTSTQCSASEQEVTCDYVGDLAAAAEWVVTIQAKIAPTLDAGTVLSNTATVTSGSPEPTLANNTATVSDTLTANADLRITFDIEMSDSTPGAYDGPGSSRTVKVMVANYGPSTAKNVQLRSNVIVDALIDTDMPIGCYGVNKELVCDVAEIPPGQGTNSFSFTFHITPSWNELATWQACSPNAYTPPHLSTCADTSLPPGGWAEVTSTTQDSDLSNNGDTSTLSLTQQRTDLLLVETALNTIANPTELLSPHQGWLAGSLFSYQISATVAPDAGDAQNVVISDTLPSGFTITDVSPSQLADGQVCSATATSFSCPVGTVSGTGIDRVPQQVTLTVTGLIDQTYLENYAYEQVVNKAQATSSTPHLDGTGYDTAPAEAQATVDIFDEADLAQFKVADAATFYAGSQIGWTLMTVNNGPSAATGTVVTDTLPPGLTFSALDSDPSCALVSTAGDGTQTVSCAIGEMASGASKNVRLVANSVPKDTVPYWCDDKPDVLLAQCPEVLAPTHPTNWNGLVRTITNTATVSFAATDPDMSNNTAVASANLNMLADAAVTAAVSTNTPMAGQSVLFTVTGINNGPSTGDAPHVVATFPPGFIVDESSINITQMTCTLTHSGTPVVYRLECDARTETPYMGTFTPGIVTPGTAVAYIPADIPTGNYTLTSTISLQTPESDYSNNTASVDIHVVRVSDTSIVKRQIGKAAVAGEVTYELAVTNHGPSEATDVMISDTVPTGLSFVAGAVVNGATCPEPTVRDNQRTLYCNAGTLAVGQTVLAQVTFQIPDDFALTTQLCNAAVVGSNSLDPDSANNATQICGSVGPKVATGGSLASTPSVRYALLAAASAALLGCLAWRLLTATRRK
ncbi:MAG: DUF11 domain-containing protein [Propionibacteriaceae bacterium]|jgi:uncharacterized repeat protein (TIGR01451 family)/fimbrial isopeptide formation D2 family protein|nr:DUF11 domain-containing protein [Propionibacteriaceae bacterium]